MARGRGQGGGRDESVCLGGVAEGKREEKREGGDANLGRWAVFE